METTARCGSRTIRREHYANPHPGPRIRPGFILGLRESRTRGAASRGRVPAGIYPRDGHRPSPA